MLVAARDESSADKSRGQALASGCRSRVCTWYLHFQRCKDSCRQPNQLSCISLRLNTRRRSVSVVRHKFGRVKRAHGPPSSPTWRQGPPPLQSSLYKFSCSSQASSQPVRPIMIQYVRRALISHKRSRCVPPVRIC